MRPSRAVGRTSIPAGAGHRDSANTALPPAARSAEERSFRTNPSLTKGADSLIIRMPANRTRSKGGYMAKTPPNGGSPGHPPTPQGSYPGSDVVPASAAIGLKSRIISGHRLAPAAKPRPALDGLAFARQRPLTARLSNRRLAFARLFRSARRSATFSLVCRGGMRVIFPR